MSGYPVLKGILQSSQNYTWNTADSLGRGATAVVYLGREKVRFIFIHFVDLTVKSLSFFFSLFFFKDHPKDQAKMVLKESRSLVRGFLILTSKSKYPPTESASDQQNV